MAQPKNQAKLKESSLRLCLQGCLSPAVPEHSCGWGRKDIIALNIGGEFALLFDFSRPMGAGPHPSPSRGEHFEIG